MALLPHGGPTKAMLVNSGAEAVENAVKIARQATGRAAVLCFSEAFHGRTLLGMSLTSKTAYNKTSRNTILFMVNIGSTRGSATYLLDVLVRIGEELEERAAECDRMDTARAARRIRSLVEQFPPLPHFSGFHPAFVTEPGDDHHEGDMRGAFFLSYDEDECEYLPLDGSVGEALRGGRVVTSAAFVTPYPPGFPVLVPGQTVSENILAYLRAVDVKEIHGFDAERGLRVFRQETLERLLAARTPAHTRTTTPRLEEIAR